MKKIIALVCVVVLIVSVIIYAISNSDSKSNSNNKGNACAFVRDFDGKCVSQCGENQIVTDGNCKCKDGYTRDNNDCKKSLPPPPPSPSPCDNTSQKNASGVCTKWELIQTTQMQKYDKQRVAFGGISDKGPVIYTPDGIKVNDIYVYKDNMNIYYPVNGCSLNIALDLSGVLYMCINGQWTKNDQLKSNGILGVAENSSSFFAFSKEGTLYVYKKQDVNASWVKRDGTIPEHSSFINVNDKYIVSFGGDNGKVYLSDNVGQTWTNVTIPNAKIYWHCYLSSDALLVATETGLYRLDLPNVNNLKRLLTFTNDLYQIIQIYQYKDEIIVLLQDESDEDMMPVYIFYSPDNGNNFIKLNVIVSIFNNQLRQLASGFNDVYVYNGVIYANSNGLKISKFFFEPNSFLYKFNAK